MGSWSWKAAFASFVLLSLAVRVGAQESNKFLPTPPDPSDAKLPWLVTDLNQVAEISFQKVEPIRDPVLVMDEKKLTAKEQESLRKAHTEALRLTQDMVGKINKANETGPDHFMKVLVLLRRDLAGLPWAMGDECRTGPDRSAALAREVLVLRTAMRMVKNATNATPNKIDSLEWDCYDKLAKGMNSKLPMNLKRDDLPPARIAAMMQILGPASANVRMEMVQRIAAINAVEATHALARLAVFATESDIRKSAVAALKDRQKVDYTAILMQAMRYPWPGVADNASAALIALDCQDQVRPLVDLLGEPDPRAPKAKGRSTVVREVVKLNHHHNCLLCHPPVKSNDSLSPSAVVQAEIPSPAQPLPLPSAGYGMKKSNIHLAIRVDVTYLRQDFSRLEKVASAAPWPDWQRFDFLVREREVGPAEVNAYQAWRANQGAGFIPANQQSALNALRALTGRNAGTTATAWRQVLGL